MVNCLIWKYLPTVVVRLLNDGILFSREEHIHETKLQRRWRNFPVDKGPSPDLPPELSDLCGGNIYNLLFLGNMKVCTEVLHIEDPVSVIGCPYLQFSLSQLP